MTKRKPIYFVLMILLSLNLVLAFSYGVSSPSLQTSNAYSGDDLEYEATITASESNVCTIVCSWTTDNYNGDIGNPEPLSKGESKKFIFQVWADGSGGGGTDTLSVSCNKVTSWNCLVGSDSSKPQIPIPFSFDYAGDGECQTNNNEDCTNVKSDCSCPSRKSCIDNGGDSSRTDLDSMKCATYCGNGVKESSYETCSNCPSDVGKCNGISCTGNSECEGNYCVHEKCWNEPYKKDDGYCDSTNGENCKNSVADCSCGSSERCGSTAVCETYCGNNVCESSEVGKCDVDCQWCGDGECDASKGENCNTCDPDCGVCEDEEYNQELQTNTQNVINEGLKNSSQKQKIISYSAIGLILLVILGYIGFKLLLNGKPKRKRKTTKKKRSKKKK